MSSGLWQDLGVLGNATISVAYFGIAALILVPLLRTHHVRANKLATATFAIFFSCGVGHGMHALLSGDSSLGMNVWWASGWAVVTACIAVYYLTLRRLYGGILVSAPLFDDFAEKEHVARLEALRDANELRALAESERDANAAMLQAVTANNHCLIYVKDLDGRYLMVNPAFERAFGLRPSDIVGQSNDALAGELAPTIQSFDLRAQHESFRVEAWIDMADGRHWFDVFRFPLRDATGAVYATGGVSLDVTEQKRTNQQLIEARDTALAATAEKSTFLSTMSHEIRTPMNAVIGMTDLLLDTPLNRQQHEFVQTVRSSGDALLGVINDILDYSKFEAGELQLEVLPFDLRDVVEGCLDVVAVAAAAKGLDLVCYVDDTCPERVAGDALRLRQILANLLSNAVKFTEYGEVLVTVTTAAAEDGRLQVKVSVIDTGIGISPGGVERLFKSFSQVDASTTRVYGGTGLGLAISQRLAEAMGGRIEVVSSPTRGSTFTLLAILDPTPDAPRVGERTRQATATLTGRSVLIVDDNATSLRILDLQLTGLGMICTTARRPQDALALVTGGLTYDVALLDMRMPGINGVELGDALRQAQGATDAPLVMLTMMGWRPDGLESSFAAFLTKPVKSVVLRDTLAAVLSGMPLGPELSFASTVLPLPAGQQPLAILLAEDNVVNQRVGELMLNKLGHQVEIVGNGLEAVDAVRTREFDVVLMDMQMPVMDGLDATRLIRAELAPGQQPFIVAMTANAMADDQETCLAAGMDAYLSKPVRAHELQAMLAKVGAFISHRSERSEPGSNEAAALHIPPPPPPDPTGQAVDEDVLAALMTDLGDENGEIRSEAITVYLTESADQVTRLVTAAADADRATVATIAHSLRSTSKLLGAANLAAVLWEQEKLAKGDAGDLTPLAMDVSVEYDRVASSLALLVAG